MSIRSESHLEDSRLYEYLDGVLEDNARDFVEAHLRTCAFCEERLREIRSLFETIVSLSDEPMKRDLSPIVMAAIQPKNSVARQNRFTIAIQLLVLGILAAVLWSSLGRLVEQWIISPLGLDVITSLQRVQIELPQLWDKWINILSAILADSSKLAARVPLPSFPQFDRVEVFLVVFIGWILVNGLLLRTSAANILLRRT